VDVQEDAGLLPDALERCYHEIIFFLEGVDDCSGRGLFEGDKADFGNQRIDGFQVGSDV
jgi:hypothetical protein